MNAEGAARSHLQNVATDAEALRNLERLFVAGEVVASRTEVVRIGLLAQELLAFAQVPAVHPEFAHSLGAETSQRLFSIALARIRGGAVRLQVSDAIDIAKTEQSLWLSAAASGESLHALRLLVEPLPVARSKASEDDGQVVSPIEPSAARADPVDRHINVPARTSLSEQPLAPEEVLSRARGRLWIGFLPGKLSPQSSELLEAVLKQPLFGLEDEYAYTLGSAALSKDPDRPLLLRCVKARTGIAVEIAWDGGPPARVTVGEIRSTVRVRILQKVPNSSALFDAPATISWKLRRGLLVLNRAVKSETS